MCLVPGSKNLPENAFVPDDSASGTSSANSVDCVDWIVAELQEDPEKFPVLADQFLNIVYETPIDREKAMNLFR